MESTTAKKVTLAIPSFHSLGGLPGTLSGLAKRPLFWVLLLGLTLAFSVWSFALDGAGAESASAGPQTTVCGPYLAPSVVMGIPQQINVTGVGSSIRMADNFVLNLGNIPSLYLGRLGLLQMQDGKAVAYATVGDPKFDPCKAPAE